MALIAQTTPRMHAESAEGRFGMFFLGIKKSPLNQSSPSLHFLNSFFLLYLLTLFPPLEPIIFAGVTVVVISTDVDIGSSDRDVFGYGASLGGPLCHTHNLTLRLFSRTCLHTTSDEDQTRPHKKHNQHDKQNHHGGEATHPSSGVDLMNPCRLSGERPCACSSRCRHQSDSIESINEYRN
jgi:hypothetical protein